VGDRPVGCTTSTCVCMDHAAERSNRTHGWACSSLLCAQHTGVEVIICAGVAAGHGLPTCHSFWPLCSPAPQSIAAASFGTFSDTCSQYLTIS
jgi:hypothetical protein